MVNLLIPYTYYRWDTFAVGTTKGIRICQVNSNGDLIMGPLLVETSYSVNGFTERGSYLYAATKVQSKVPTYERHPHSSLTCRKQFDDGTFALCIRLQNTSRHQMAIDPTAPKSTTYRKPIDLEQLLTDLVMVSDEGGYCW